MELPNQCKTCDFYGRPYINREQHGATCPSCNTFRPLSILPLFILTGASGVGKSAIIPSLRTHLAPQFHIFDKDQIWVPDAQQLTQHTLRVAYSAAQCGVYTVLSGLFLPKIVENCDLFPFFEPIFWLNIHCNDELRAERLRARPAWRNWNEQRILENEVLAKQLQTQLSTVDSSSLTIEETAAAVASWVECSRSKAGYL